MRKVVIVGPVRTADDILISVDPDPVRNFYIVCPSI
jgi:hypothetical protein